MSNKQIEIKIHRDVSYDNSAMLMAKGHISPLEMYERMLFDLRRFLQRHISSEIDPEDIAERVAEELAHPQTNNDGLLTIEEAHEYLAISKRTLEYLIEDGKITPVRIGRARRFDKAQLRAFVRKCAKKHGT